MSRSIKELAKEYATISGSGRQKIVNEEIQEHDLEDLQSTVRSYYGKKVATEHKDKKFLAKLVAWAVVETSSLLDKEAMAVLDRHRKTHLEKGPDLDAGKEQELGKTKKEKEKAMKTVSKKGKTEKGTESKKVTETKKASKKKTPTFAFTSGKYVIAKDAPSVGGGNKIVVDLFKKPISFDEAVKQVEKLLASKKLKLAGNPEWLVNVIMTNQIRRKVLKKV